MHIWDLPRENIGNDVSDNFIVGCVFVGAVTVLQNHCLATKKGAQTDGRNL
jgi:hypothetical protein